MQKPETSGKGLFEHWRQNSDAGQTHPNTCFNPPIFPLTWHKWQKQAVSKHLRVLDASCNSLEDMSCMPRLASCPAMPAPALHASPHHTLPLRLFFSAKQQLNNVNTLCLEKNTIARFDASQFNNVESTMLK